MWNLLLLVALMGMEISYAMLLPIHQQLIEEISDEGGIRLATDRNGA